MKAVHIILCILLWFAVRAQSARMRLVTIKIPGRTKRTKDLGPILIFFINKEWFNLGVYGNFCESSTLFKI